MNVSVWDLETTIRKQLEDRLSRTLGDEFRLYLGDENFWLTPLHDVVDLMNRQQRWKLQYKPNTFDCDKFASVLRADMCLSTFGNPKREFHHAFGEVWGIVPGGAHAINVMVNSDGALRFVEPQLPPAEAIKPVDEYDLRGIWFMRI